MQSLTNPPRHNAASLEALSLTASATIPPTRQSTAAIETALAVLAQSGVAELRFLRVDENDSEICLTGRVKSFYHKQLAQEAVRPVAAGRQVINRIHVHHG